MPPCLSKERSMDKKKIRSDIILAAVILSFSIFALCTFFFARAEGAYAVVMIDGRQSARYSLSQDTEVEIKSENGVNILRIEDGKASVISASCHDGVCVRHKAVSRDGETIICLPNKLIIRIDSAEDGGVDVAV